MVGAEGGETNFWQKKNILVPYGTELPGVPKLKLQETGCLIFNREDLNSELLSCYTTVTPIALVGILVCGFPSDVIIKKKDFENKALQMQPSGVAFSIAKV